LFTTGTSVIPLKTGHPEKDGEKETEAKRSPRLKFGDKKKRSVANGGLKSVSALPKKLMLFVLRLQAQTNKK
jgi:hypothetical protein